MNKHPIETALDKDLRLSQQAMHRAARRARELAVKTGTVLIVSHHGVIEQIHPLPETANQSIMEPKAPYDKKL